MDLADKNFKPCPCGYQVCQFCYNNIRQNPQLNGKCPACRRLYSDDTVEYRMISAEEWKQDHLRQARREKERKQREREKKESAENSLSSLSSSSSKKHHLSGMRVIQKNLVYVIGLNPNIPTDELHHTLRGDQFFGQYGKIQKIVINRRNNANGNPGLGVYVTFARKEDAARCIAAVDGSMNEGKYLRAAYGTTKYCSSYLRGQTCPNPNCMFLHEPGEEADSYTRQDLSTIHASRQGIKASSSSTPRPGAVRKDTSNSAAAPSNDENQNSHSNGTTVPIPPSAPVSASNVADDGSALPATVSWAQKGQSPVVANQRPQVKTRPSSTSSPSPSPTLMTTVAPEPQVPKIDATAESMNQILEALGNGPIDYKFQSGLISEEDLKDPRSIPPFFSFVIDANGNYNDKSSNRPQSDLVGLFTLNQSGLGGKQGSFLGYSSDPAATMMGTIPQNQQPQIPVAQQQQFQNVPQPQLQQPTQPQVVQQQQAKTSTPPPPGLLGGGHHQSAPSQDRQVLLAQLMNGGRGKQEPIQS